jgi:hypothetical protein
MLRRSARLHADQGHDFAPPRRLPLTHHGLIPRQDSINTAKLCSASEGRPFRVFPFSIALFPDSGRKRVS